MCVSTGGIHKDLLLGKCETFVKYVIYLLRALGHFQGTNTEGFLVLVVTTVKHRRKRKLLSACAAFQGIAARHCATWYSCRIKLAA